MFKKTEEPQKDPSKVLPLGNTSSESDEHSMKENHKIAVQTRLDNKASSKSIQHRVANATRVSPDGVDAVASHQTKMSQGGIFSHTDIGSDARVDGSITHEISNITINKRAIKTIPRTEEKELSEEQIFKIHDSPTTSTITLHERASTQAVTVNQNCTIIQDFHRSAVVRKPSSVEAWNLPEEIQHFIPREGLMEQIELKLASGTQDTTVLSVLRGVNKTILLGMGGVGKTTLANHLIHKKDYSFKAWFNAESMSSLQGQYFNLGIVCQLYEKEDRLGWEVIKHQVLHHLETYPGWLLVYDNVEKYEDIQGLLPQKGGHIVITSRHQSWPKENVIDVDMMTREEARALIRSITGTTEEDAIIDKLVVEKMGLLPLAISQACGYIRANQNMTVTKYIRLYDQYAKELLNANEMPPGDVHCPVAMTWKINIDEIQKNCPDGVSLLKACAFLDPVDISEEIMEKYFEKRGRNAVEYNAAKMALLDYSLMNAHENETLSLHRLVQTVTCFNLPHAEAIRILKDLIELFLEKLHQDEYTVLREQRPLLVHLDALLHGVISQKGEDLAFWNTFEKFAELYLVSKTKQDLEKSIKYFEYLLPIKEKWLKEAYCKKGIQVVHNLNSLGSAYRFLGGEENLKKALALYQRALETGEKSLEEDHQDIALSLHNLGNVYWERGGEDNLRQAIPYHARALAIRMHRYKKFGEKEHCHMAHSLNALGNVYCDLGGKVNLNKAINYQNEALVIWKKYLPEHHPHVARGSNDLGTAYYALGGEENLKWSIVYQKEALSIRRRHYGDCHFLVARSLNDLAFAYYDLGGEDHRVTAKDYDEKALSIQLKGLKEISEETALSEYHLGLCYITEGNLTEGIPLIQKAFASFRQTDSCGNRFVQRAKRSLEQSKKVLNNPSSNSGEKTQIQPNESEIQIGLPEITAFETWVNSVEKTDNQDAQQLSNWEFFISIDSVQMQEAVKIIRERLNEEDAPRGALRLAAKKEARDCPVKKEIRLCFFEPVDFQITLAFLQEVECLLEKANVKLDPSRHRVSFQLQWAINALRSRITELEQYGQELSTPPVQEMMTSFQRTKEYEKGICISELTATLSTQMADFERDPQTEYNKFSDHFTQTLNRYRETLKEHRDSWKPVIMLFANLLLALTGIGTLILAANAAYVLTQKEGLTSRSGLFGMRTNSEKKALEVEFALEELESQLKHQ